ncbi:hypothetical protein GCM10023346_22200 [Arthrobacter gyeryongensis]|uniref:Uncharacterized protein n=2 Tax=Arthrobacter gyeryongensis TaxID=1650592 RepID=A0ABP9SDE1_9MICC
MLAKRPVDRVAVDAHKMHLLDEVRAYQSVAGDCLGEARRFNQSTVLVDGAERKLDEFALAGNYHHDGDERDDNAEWVVPVEWARAVPREQTVRKTGLFAIQNTAARMRNQFTIEHGTAAFGLDGEAPADGQSLRISIEVSMYKYPCMKCTQPFWWVMWMRAVSPQPADWQNAWPGGPEAFLESGRDFRMPVMIDQPSAASCARYLLRHLDLRGRARHLVDRRLGLPGASYNANRCPACFHIAYWYYYEQVVIAASQDQRRLFVAVPTELATAEWAKLIDDQNSVWVF